MPAVDLTPYNQAQGSTSDGTKFDNLLAVIQAALNGLDGANFAAGQIIDLSKLKQDGATDGQVATWNAGASAWQPATPSGGTSAVPAGTIVEYGGSTAPSGWLLADGSAVSRTTYATLFTAINTAYGAGDGSTTFNVPDFRGRVPVGFAASGGHTDVSALGNNDGVSAANRRPKHRHTPHFHDGTSQAAGSGAASAYQAVGSGSHTETADGGSGNANDSLDAPAYLVVNKLIKT